MKVKRCYEHSIEADGQGGKVTPLDTTQIVDKFLQKVLSRLLNTAVSAGKRVRSETGISRGAVSISSAAVEFSAMKLVSDFGSSCSTLQDARIVIIGIFYLF